MDIRQMLVFAFSVFFSTLASSEVTCSVATTNVYSIYNPGSGAHSDTAGSVTLTCTRTANEPLTRYWIGIGNGLAGRALKRQAGNETLAYEIYRDSGRTVAWGTTFGNAVNGILFFRGSSVATTTLTYYMRVPNSNSGKPAGLYDDLIAVTQRVKRTDPDMSTATLNPVVSILPECRLSSMPAPIRLNYTSFSPTPATATTRFDVSCTASTPYTMALDATSGKLLGLNYSLSLSANSGIGNAVPISYAITATIAPNQAGICNSAICASTEARTIVISY